MFASSAAGLWEVSGLDVGPDAVVVDRELYLVPLVPAVPLGEPALVAVVNRRRGSLYRVENGSVEELADVSDPDVPRRHDQGGWSQANYERHVDELAHRHMETVAHAIDRRFREEGRPPVVLVCPEDERSEVQDLLATDVQAAVIGWTSVEAHAGARSSRRPCSRCSRSGAPGASLRRCGAGARSAEWGAGRSGLGGRALRRVRWPRRRAALRPARRRGDRLPVHHLPARGRTRRAMPGRRQRGGAVDALNLALLRTLGYGGTAVAIGDRAALDGEAVSARLRW